MLHPRVIQGILKRRGPTGLEASSNKQAQTVGPRRAILKGSKRADRFRAAQHMKILLDHLSHRPRDLGPPVAEAQELHGSITG